MARGAVADAAAAAPAPAAGAEGPAAGVLPAPQGQGGDTRNSSSRGWTCGLTAGAVSAWVLNPWDRALYLSVLHHRPFLSSANFERPYQGVNLALMSRIVSHGLYFPLEEALLRITVAAEGDGVFARMVAGNAAGLLNGMLINPLSVIKYNLWGSRSTTLVNWKQAAGRMYMEKGYRAFARGAAATVGRDAVFGGVFSVLRHTRADDGPGMRGLLVNGFSAAVATTLSSPLNYLRNVRFAGSRIECSHSSAFEVFRSLLRDSAAAPRPLHFLRIRLNVGWGTVRVAVGMGMASQLYAACILGHAAAAATAATRGAPISS
eukprot:TRINITY_DN37392_c0_g1_i1.p1 TRINITY_DN37392_c0_g1~~TRINITY_DN37392_c0_g1_i1.p1  ORF type:complete len:319 (+),score=61.44 TRINITY_DN37392_c0_g1_i1:131-1087(+)